MYCKKCGNELKDNSLFCDQCGNKVQETASHPQNDWRIKIGLKRIVIILCLICIVAFVGYKIIVHIRTDEKLTEEFVNSIVDSVPEETEFVEEYFENEITNGGYVSGAITADAEILLRGQQVFDGVDVVVQGTVNSILPTDYSDEFFLVIYHPSYDGNKIDKIAVKGKYPDSNSRYVVGDSVWFIGKYAGISMFEQISGAHVEYAVVDNCKEIEHGYSLSDVNSIVDSIFNKHIELTSTTYDGDFEKYIFNRVVTENQISEFWEFDPLGGNPRVSYDGGHTFYWVDFDSGYQNYMAVYNDPNGKSDRLKFYTIEGKELWAKEFATSENENTYFELHNDMVCVYNHRQLYFLDKNTGENIVDPILVPETNNMRIVNNKILLFVDGQNSKDSIIAVDTNGKILWTYDASEECEIGYEYSHTDDSYILFEYNNENNDVSFNKKYVRIDLEDGKKIAEVKN